MNTLDMLLDKKLASFETLRLLIAPSSSVKNRNRYEQALKANMRALWSGVMTVSEFQDAMFFSVERGLRVAWNKGFMVYNILPDEQSQAERQYIFNYIFDQQEFINNLARFINGNSRANKGKLRTTLAKAELWTKRYDEVFNEAKARAAGNQKLEWRLGIAEHCTSCVKLNGQVRRGAFWMASRKF